MRASMMQTPKHGESIVAALLKEAGSVMAMRLGLRGSSLRRKPAHR
jgi:hypothetical protein